MSKSNDEQYDALTIPDYPYEWCWSDIFYNYSQLLWSQKLTDDEKDDLMPDTTIQTWIALLGHPDAGI